MMIIKTRIKQNIFVSFFTIFFTVFTFNVFAADVCVSTTTELQDALTDAATSNEDDVIKVEQGTYLLTGSEFLYSSIQTHSISVLGGYTAECLDREINPTNTILSRDSGSGRVININGGTTGGAQHLQGFTIENGDELAMFATGAGAYVGGPSGFSGDVLVDTNIFLTNNNSASISGGLNVSTAGVICKVNNNLFYQNNADTAGAGFILCNGTDGYVVNNTIVENTLTVGGSTTSVGGLTVAGLAKMHVYNNIAWGNADNDIRISSASNIFISNDIENLSGVLGVGSTGNLNVDPLFVNVKDFHLQETSPTIDQGSNSPPGGLPSRDLDNNFRVMGGRVDMGAYEFPQEDDTSCFVIKAINGAVPVFCL